MDLTQEEYEQKRREIMAKFNKQFIDNNYTYDSYTRMAVESLIRGANPYEIIEFLVTANQELFAQYKKLIDKQPPAPIILEK